MTPNTRGNNEGGEGRAALLCGDATRDASLRTMPPAGTASGEVRFFAQREDDVLDREVLDGRIGHVHFADFPALLEAVWRGNIQVDRWLARGVQLHLQESEGLGAEEWGLVQRAVAESWASWCCRRRRREIVAACVLCGAALLAGAVVLICTPG